MEQQLNNWFDILNNYNLYSFNFDLQRFASAEAEGRTEKPTEHKKKKSREEGRVALSKDLPSALITLFTFVLIYFLGEYFFKVMIDTLLYVLQNIKSLSLTNNNLFFDILIIPSFKILLPIFIISTIVALLSNYMQIGIKFTSKTIKPDLKKISPNILKFFQKQVFSITGLFNLIKSFVKIAIIGVVTFVIILNKIHDILKLIYVDNIFDSIYFIVNICFQLIIITSIILLIFSIIDIIFVRWHYEEELKMKKQEVKEEIKELYGDPEIKSRLRQMYQTLLSQKKMLSEVPKSDVVITNPTHYAVALRYNKDLEDAPRVVAKGEDKFAQKIKEIARENNIPMYENVVLARMLYNELNVNQIIPPTFYSLVVNAYKFAYEYKEKHKNNVASEEFINN